MTDLTESQREQVRGMISSVPDRIDERLQQLEEGKVVEHAVPAVYHNIGRKSEKVAICHVYECNVATAQEWFTQATQRYWRAVEAAFEQPPFGNPHRRIPMTLVEALYASACAGGESALQESASKIFELDPTDGVEAVEDEIVFNPDKYYLARCLAGTVLDRVAQDDLEELTAINDEKPETDQHYGQAIIDVATGIDADDPALLERGTHAALEYHDQNRDPDNVIKRIMAREATALLIIVRQQGYDITVDSEFIPMELLETITR